MLNNYKMNLLRGFVAGVALIFSVYANADVIKTVVLTNFVFVDNPSSTPLRLATAGGTSTSFNAATAGKYTIIYSAACNVQGGVLGDIFLIDIRVDGNTISPSGPSNGDVFCGADTGYHTEVVRTGSLTAGSHTVQIQGSLQAASGATIVALGPSTLLIMK